MCRTDRVTGAIAEDKSPACASDGVDLFEDDILDAPKARSTASAARARYISQDMIGPPCSLLQDRHPDWRFELGPGNWRSYPLEESIELDRYWTFYTAMRQKDSSIPHLAKVQLMRREGEVDFSKMSCQVGSGRPRKLKRETTLSDWLSNTYFSEAFTAALSSAGVKVESTPEEMFDFRFNQDFREVKDDGRKLFRGGQPYELPIGWKRFAVNVKGQYDDGDNTWLREDDSGWAVAYHGTAKDSLPGILCTGFRVGSRQKFEKELGAGVYCTPWIGVAQHYSKPQMHRGHSVQIVLQLRVKPSAVRLVTHKKATDFERKYWVINEPGDVRAYGVLVRELGLRDWVPPEAMVYGKEHPEVQRLLRELRAEAQACGRAAAAP